MTVAHVGRWDGPVFDGVSKTVRAQTAALSARGINVEVWQFEAGLNDIQTFESRNGIQVHKLPRFRNALLSAIDAPFKTKQWVKRRSQEIDICHFHSVFTGHNNFAARLAPCYAVTPHGGWSSKVIAGRSAALKTVWIKLFERQLWQGAKFVQSLSPFESNELLALDGIAPIEYIPNGIEIPEVDLASGRPEPNTWLFLGRMAFEQKGLDLIIHAYHLAMKRDHDLPRLFMAGPDFRGGLSKAQELVEALDLTEKIEILGPVSEDVKRKMLSNAGVFIHTSRWEGLPMSIVEALAHGVPCVVTPETGLAEWVAQHNCGWSTFSDAQSISQTLVQIASDSRQIRDRSILARAAVAETFSWTTAAEKLETCYRQ